MDFWDYSMSWSGRVSNPKNGIIFSSHSLKFQHWTTEQENNNGIYDNFSTTCLICRNSNFHVFVNRKNPKKYMSWSAEVNLQPPKWNIQLTSSEISTENMKIITECVIFRPHELLIKKWIFVICLPQISKSVYILMR